MSKNIIEVVGDSVSDCLKVAIKQLGCDEESMSAYISGMLGGTLISFFSPHIGVPLILFSTVGGVIDVLLPKNNSVVKVEEEANVGESKVIAKEENIEAIKYDIFRCIGCRNSLKEYPEFIRMQDGGYVYSRPEGIKLIDVKEYSEDICLALGLTKLEVLLIDNNRHLLLREFVDKLGSYVPYVNNQRDTRGKLKAFIGVCYKKDKLEPVEINFTDRNHVMVASTTGEGKSSLLRVIIVDLMLNYGLDELEFYFIDMKRTELTVFNDYMHTVTDCITEHKAIPPLLEKLWNELSRRKDIVTEVKLQNIYQYNEAYPSKKEKYIVVVIDEMLEVVNSGDKDDVKVIKNLLGLLLSQGRAFGIYFILSTQQPSRKLIEGSIQSNVGQRISLRVASKTDAEVVFDGVNTPLHLIDKKGRAFYLFGGTPIELQSYYIGDPKLKNEPEVLANLLKKFKKEEVSVESIEVVDNSYSLEGNVISEVAQTVDKPKKKIKSNKEIRAMLYKTKEGK